MIRPHRKGDIITYFYDQVAESVDEKGVQPMPSVFIDAQGGLNMQMNLFNGPDIAQYMMAAAAVKPAREGANEIIFGIDRFARPGQQLELSDFVGVYYYDGRSWRFAVIEYAFRDGGEKILKPIVKPLDWSKSFWIQKQQEELAHYLGGKIKIRRGNPAPTVLPPAMSRPTWITAEKIAEWEAKRLKDTSLMQSLEEGQSGLASVFRGFGCDLKECWYAGEWLHEQLTDRDVDPGRARRICFANGQRNAMIADPWGTAVWTLEHFTAGDIDVETPGPALAQKLFNEQMPYFANMYGIPSRETVEQAVAARGGQEAMEKMSRELLEGEL